MGGDIFKLGVPAAASKFCEWIQVGIDVYIPHRKYQIKLTEITFFVCNNRINLLLLK